MLLKTLLVGIFYLGTIVVVCFGDKGSGDSSVSPTGDDPSNFTRVLFDKNDEARLIEDLLETYKSRGAGMARPVADSTDRLIVTMKFIIHEYEGIHDVTKRMRLAGMLKATWKDAYLGT